MTIRVLIADDQAMVRAGFRMILSVEDDMDVVGEASDGREAVELARTASPDVVLMDVRMPVSDGIEATEAIGELADPPHVLILTTFGLDEYVYGALRAGASGFLLKEAPPEQLVDAIRIVAAGESLLAPSVTRRLIAQFVSRSAPHQRTAAATSALQRLSPREREVLELVARALSNAEIAERLFVSEATVKTHIARLLAKLDLRDRTQAVVFAYENGIVQPST